jgi:hypothetical protein
LNADRKHAEEQAMSSSRNENRRDPRYSFKPGHAQAEFDDPFDPDRRWCAELLGLSPAGVSVRLDAAVRLQPDTALPAAVLQIGECVLHGSIVVKNVVAIDDATTAIGGLFYPRTEIDAAKLMALIAGMEAIDTIWALPPRTDDESTTHSTASEDPSLEASARD